MIRLLVDMHSFDWQPEGVTTYLKGLYSALIPLAKEDVQFFFAASDCDKLKSIFGEHANLQYIPIAKTRLLKRLLFIYPKLIRSLNIDYAHFQYTVPFWCNCKRIVTIHDVFFEDFKEGYSFKYAFPRHVLFRYAARHAELVCTMCDYSRGRIAVHYGVAAEKIIITPNAVSEHFANEVTQSSFDVKKQYGIDGKYILYLSRKEPRKNHLGLVKAYYQSRLWEQKVWLALVGGTSIPVPSLIAYINSLPGEARKHILLIEHVDHEELLGWYKHASAFVFPSLAEGFGIPPLEAAVCLIPVLCSNRTSMREFSFFGDRLIDPENITEFAEKLTNILQHNDKQLLTDTANNVLARYSWKKTAGDFLRIVSSHYAADSV